MGKIKYVMTKRIINGLLLFVLFSCGTQVDMSKEKDGAKTLITERVVVTRDEPFFQEPIDFATTDDTLYNQYKDDQKEGLWVERDRNGLLQAEGYYKNGKANGWMKWYHEGQLIAMGKMIDGQRNGPWKICDVNDASFCIDANFINESREGLWKIYHDTGELWKEQIWKNDQPLSEKCWDKNGQTIPCEAPLQK